MSSEEQPIEYLLTVHINDDNSKSEPKLSIKGRYDPTNVLSKPIIDEFVKNIRIAWIEESRNLKAGKTQ